MRLRIVTAAVVLPTLAILVLLGGWWFSLGVAVVSAAGVLEICHMARKRGFRSLSTVSVLISVSIVAVSHFVAQDPFVIVPVPGILGALSIAYLIWILGNQPPRSGMHALGTTIAPALYVGGLLFYAPVLRGIEEGLQWMLVALTVTFAADTGSLMAGRIFGTHPMAPAVSPSKTWEGAFFGLAVAMLITPFGAMGMDLVERLPVALGLGLGMSVTGQVGDLVESRLKRVAGFKDSGVIMPGHGGVLDRLDSIVFTLPFVYYSALWVAL